MVHPILEHRDGEQEAICSIRIGIRNAQVVFRKVSRVQLFVWEVVHSEPGQEACRNYLLKPALEVQLRICSIDDLVHGCVSCHIHTALSYCNASNLRTG